MSGSVAMAGHATPERLRRFKAALALAEKTPTQFAGEIHYHPAYLSGVVAGRDHSPKVTALVDAFIRQYFPDYIGAD